MKKRIKKLVIGDAIIKISDRFTCDWCGSEEGIAFLGKPIKYSVPTFDNIGFKYIIDDYEKVYPLFGSNYRKIKGEPEYENIYLDKFYYKTKETDAPAICQDCCKQLAEYKA